MKKEIKGVSCQGKGIKIKIIKEKERISLKRLRKITKYLDKIIILTHLIKKYCREKFGLITEWQLLRALIYNKGVSITLYFDVKALAGKK